MIALLFVIGLRVVSLAPNITEIIYAIGADSELVGVVTPCDYPPGIDKPIVGSFMVPNYEKIQVLEPDIVLITGGVQERIAEELNKLGLHVEVIRTESIDEIFTAIDTIGKLLGHERQADSLVKVLREKLGKVSQPPHRWRVYVEVWYNPIITVGRRSYINEMVQLAGGYNIGDTIDATYPVVSPEWVVTQNPEVILMLCEDAPPPSDRIGWQSVPAVRYNRVLMPEDLNIFLRPGPRVVDAIKWLNEKLCEMKP